MPGKTFNTPIQYYDIYYQGMKIRKPAMFHENGEPVVFMSEKTEKECEEIWECM